MERKLKQITIIFLALLLMLPAFHNLIYPLPAPEMGGEVTKVKFPELTTEKLMEGGFQRKFERWFSHATGLWPYLVKTENQINYSGFGLASPNYRSTVVLGNDNNLIERAYLKAASKLQNIPEKRLETKARKLAELQSRLKKRGIPLLLLISASKPAVYPEYVPESYRVANNSNRQNTYERLKPLLDQYGVNYFDGQEFLYSLRSTTEYPLFASSGTHWNEYASCLVSQKLTLWFQKVLWPNIASFNCEPVTMREIPAHPDRDLTQSLNIWLPELTYKPQPRPARERVTPENEKRPDLLFVGTSFMWSIFQHLDRHKIYKHRDFLYYFKTNHTYPERKKISLEPAKIDWEKDVFSCDAIVIEVNHAFLNKAGHGFVKAALKNLA